MKNNVINEEVLTKSPFKDITTNKYETEIKKEQVYNFFKRFLDIVGGGIGIILLIPLTIIIYTLSLIKREKGKIFYTQKRIGKNGKVFKMYKYRSMVENADEILEKYLEENEDIRNEYKINKKLKNDPRVTKVGKFIRKTSIDEFPQFINVLKGEMTLVGPRPYLPKEIEDMGSAYKEIVKVKPGITGYWQVSGRNNVTFEDRLKLDIEYCKIKSLKLDIKILFSTIKKVIKREGAI